MNESLSNLCLFDDAQLQQSSTEGIKYAGLKLKLLPYILRLVNEIRPSSILDGFAGSTRVTQAFAKGGYRVISNDLAVWSKVFSECYLLAHKPASYYQKQITHLNSLPPVDGWFTENYGGVANEGNGIQSDGLKKPWQVHVTRKLDAIRDEIDRIAEDPIDKSVLLTSLILALDQVDNTIGHYAAYLGSGCRDRLMNWRCVFQVCKAFGMTMRFAMRIFFQPLNPARRNWLILTLPMDQIMRRCRPRACGIRLITMSGQPFA